MALRLGFSDQKVWVYRDKWGAISLASMAFVICIGTAIVFYLLAEHQAAFWFFSGVFGLVAFAMLIRLPKLVKQVLSDNGAILLVAEASGLTVTDGFGTVPRIYPWDSVAEIVLAEKLRLVDTDETTYLRHALIVFLSPTSMVNAKWLDRVKLGVSRTNQGRLYVLSAYPAKKHLALLSALKTLAPTLISARYEPWLRFDTVTDVMCTRKDRS